MTEQGLVGAAMQGDAQAFNTLVSQYQRVMVASARRIVCSTEAAEDLAQEALFDAYRHLPTLQDRGKFRPWLFSILRHKCLDYLKARHPEELTLDELEEIPAPIPAEMPDVAELLDQLPLAYREVLVMRYLQELDVPEIAGMLGVSEQVVHQRCSRARTRLRALAAARNDRNLRQIMAGLLAFPLSDTFTHRVTKEVLTMAQITAKGKAAVGGTTAVLAWLLGWQGAATLGVVLVLGAGIGIPLAMHHRHAGAGTVPGKAVTAATSAEQNIPPLPPEWKNMPQATWDGVPQALDAAVKSPKYQQGQQILAATNINQITDKTRIGACGYYLTISLFRSLTPDQLAIIRQQPLLFSQLNPDQQDKLLNRDILFRTVSGPNMDYFHQHIRECAIWVSTYDLNSKHTTPLSVYWMEMKNAHTCTGVNTNLTQ